MTTLNIRRDVKDSFYRYKMPALLTKVEGKGNGIKTVIANMTDIAKSLHRPPAYPTKYFGLELGAQVSCDDKTGRYIVNGTPDASRLQEMLDGFISKFVLCPSCKNPETDLVVSKDSTIYTKCKACGEKKPVDQRQKLVTFILKNAPPKKPRKSKKGTAEKVNGDVSEEDFMASSRDNLVEDDSAEYLTDQIKQKISLDDEEEDDEGNPLEAFAEYLGTNPTDEQIMEKILELELRPHKAITVLVQVMFQDSILDELPKKQYLLKGICMNEKCQKGLLGGLERLVSINIPKLQPKLPLILQELYQAEILEEEVLLYWYNHPSKRYTGDREVAKNIRVSAKPFIEWLKSAEDEEEEVSNEGDEN